MIRTGEPVVLADASEDHRVGQPQVADGPIGPAIWVPLTAYGQPAGTLSVARAVGRRRSTDASSSSCSLFAAQASVILEVDQRP